MISYFDAHCDTVYRCMETGENISMDFGDGEEQRKYFADCGCLRQNGGHIDLMRAREFARYAQFFALFYDANDAPKEGMWAKCQQLRDCFLREMAANEDLICHCRTGAEVDAANAAGKCAAVLSVEGADLLECDIGRIETVAGWGVRFLNPVWNRANVLSGTNAEDTARGLSPYGKEFVRELEAYDIYADVSHISDAGFWDVIHMAQRPVVASHSNSRALCPHPRNLTDDMFRAIRDTDGVVGINLYRNFVGDDSMDTLIRHIEHFLALDGEKTVCMGGDLDGCEVLAGGLQGVQDVYKVYDALCARGYEKELLDDIFFYNLRRLL